MSKGARESEQDEADLAEPEILMELTACDMPCCFVCPGRQPLCCCCPCNFIPFCRAQLHFRQDKVET